MRKSSKILFEGVRLDMLNRSSNEACATGSCSYSDGNQFDVTPHCCGDKLEVFLPIVAKNGVAEMLSPTRRDTEDLKMSFYYLGSRKRLSISCQFQQNGSLVLGVK